MAAGRGRPSWPRAQHPADGLPADLDTARGTVVGYESLARFGGPPEQARLLVRARPCRGRRCGTGGAGLGRRARGAVRVAAELLPLCQRRPEALALRAGRGRFRGRRRPPRCRRRDHRADRGGQLRRPFPAIAPVRAAGALLAVDDAGAGFASLKHITVLRPDFVKVDRDLIAGIDADETKAAVVEALGMFTSRLDAWLVAEGVETSPSSIACCPCACRSRRATGSGRPKAAMGPADPTRSRCAGGAGPSPPTAGCSTSPSTPPGSPRREAAPIAFAADPAATWVAVVDEHDRPVGLIDRHGGAHPPLNVLPAERLADVARRIASRPAGDRHTPVVLCDEHARLLGLVTLERVLGRLADALDSGSSKNSHDAPMLARPSTHAGGRPLASSRRKGTRARCSDPGRC